MRRIRTLPGGTNDAHDAHAGEPNFITVQNKIIAKILPVNKFTTLKFLSLLHSMSGLLFLDYYVLLCNTCLYRSVRRHRYCHSSPLAEVRIPSRAAARTHFLVILKQKVLDSSISELQCKVAYNPNTFSLNWKQRTAEKAVDDALQYIKMYVEGV